MGTAPVLLRVTTVMESTQHPSWKQCDIYTYEREIVLCSAHTQKNVSFSEAKKRVMNKLFRLGVTYASILGKFLTLRSPPNVSQPQIAALFSSTAPQGPQTKWKSWRLLPPSRCAPVERTPAKVQPSEPSTGLMEATPENSAVQRPATSGKYVGSGSLPVSLDITLPSAFCCHAHYCIPMFRLGYVSLGQFRLV